MIIPNFPPAHPVAQTSSRNVDGVLASDGSWQDLFTNDLPLMIRFPNVATVLAPSIIPAQQVTVPGALPGNAPHAADSNQFIQLEDSIRREYLENHPIAFKNLFGPYVAKTLREDQIPLETKFSAEMTRAFLGQLVPVSNPLKRPSYWKQQGFAMLSTLPFGDVVQKVATTRKSGIAERDAAASEKLSKENLANFKKVVEVYSGAEVADRFDNASPAQKTQMFLDAFKVYVSQDLGFPNPYTIYTLDSDGDINDDHPERPHYSHAILNHLLGVGNPYDYGWEGYSREHKTQAFQNAFIRLTDAANQASRQPNGDVKNSEFARMIGVDTIKGGDDNVTFLDPVYSLRYTDREVISSVFGNEALAQFNKEKDSDEKGATRAAAFIMYFMLDRVIAGALIR